MATKIEWTHRPGTTGVTWNPVTGCTKISAGCKNCYAERMSKRLAGRFGYPEDDPFRVTLHPDRIEKPLRWRKPRTVFVCSMGDLFHEDVSDNFICDVFYVISQAKRHTFIVLTKRPERMYEWFNRPAAQDSKWHQPLPNVIGMVTAENQKQADKRIPWLLKSPFALRGVSVEPMLGPVDLRDLPVNETTHINALTGRERFSGAINGFGTSTGSHLSWGIVGGETGPGARPIQADWARGIRDQCRAAGVPFFFKAMGNGQPTPDDLAIREWPGG